MNLSDATFATFLTTPRRPEWKEVKDAPEVQDSSKELSSAAPPVKDAEVEEDDLPDEIQICPHCEVPGSKPTLEMKNGAATEVTVCDICGCVWPSDASMEMSEEEEDMEEALDLLIACLGFFKEILPRHNIMKKLGWEKEKEVIELAATVDLFLEQFPWKAS